MGGLIKRLAPIITVPLILIGCEGGSSSPTEPELTTPPPRGGSQLTIGDALIAVADTLYFGRNEAYMAWDPLQRTFALSDNLSMNQNDIKSVDKITVNTVDPFYNISGKGYPTYAPSMTGGVKEEATGIIRAGPSNPYIIRFNDLPEGSDLWVLYQTTDFGENMENLQVILTPGFDGRAWYEKNPGEDELIISTDAEGEVSYRLTASRFDWQNWPTATDTISSGLRVPKKR